MVLVPVRQIIPMGVINSKLLSIVHVNVTTPMVNHFSLLPHDFEDNRLSLPPQDFEDTGVYPRGSLNKAFGLAAAESDDERATQPVQDLSGDPHPDTLAQPSV